MFRPYNFEDRRQIPDFNLARDENKRAGQNEFEGLNTTAYVAAAVRDVYLDDLLEDVREKTGQWWISADSVLPAQNFWPKEAGGLL